MIARIPLRSTWTGTFLFWLLAPVAFIHAAPASRISLEVKVEQITDHLETWRSTFGYWVEREARNARVAVARVKNGGDRPVLVTVEFYLIGQRIDGQTALELYHYHRRTATLEPMRTTEVLTLSPTIVLKRLNAKDPEDRSDVSGIRPFGWLVNVRQGDKVIASAGNTPEARANVERVLTKTAASTLERMQKASDNRIARKD